MLCPPNAEDVKERYFENIIKNKGASQIRVRKMEKKNIGRYIFFISKNNRTSKWLKITKFPRSKKLIILLIFFVLVTKLKEKGTKRKHENKKKDYNLRNQVYVESTKRRSDKFDSEDI